MSVDMSLLASRHVTFWLPHYKILPAKLPNRWKCKNANFLQPRLIALQRYTTKTIIMFYYVLPHIYNPIHTHFVGHEIRKFDNVSRKQKSNSWPILIGFLDRISFISHLILSLKVPMFFSFSFSFSHCFIFFFSPYLY